MKKLVLTKDTIRDLSKSELEDVGGGNTLHGGICCADSGPTGSTCSLPGCICETGPGCLR